MFEVDLEFEKRNAETRNILSWIFTNTTGRFYSLGEHRYWFFENKDDADRFKDKWYEIPYENFVWKHIEYEIDKFDNHCIVLYFPEEHTDHNLRWKLHEWCEKNIGTYADQWYSNFKQEPKNENQDMHVAYNVAYNFCFKRKDDAMKFKLWAI